MKTQNLLQIIFNIFFYWTLSFILIGCDGLARFTTKPEPPPATETTSTNPTENKKDINQIKDQKEHKKEHKNNEANQASSSPKPKPEPLYEWHGEGHNISRIIVNTDEQKARFFAGDQEIGWATVATGVSDYPTPTGRFEILEKVENKRSNLYGVVYGRGGQVLRSNIRIGRDHIPEGGRFEGSHMPYYLRLTQDGVGLHAGPIPNPGHPASHGCIRMPREFAPVVFRHVAPGASVTITGKGPDYGDYAARQRALAAQAAAQRIAEQKRLAEQRAAQQAAAARAARISAENTVKLHPATPTLVKITPLQAPPQVNHQENQSPKTSPSLPAVAGISTAASPTTTTAITSTNTNQTTPPAVPTNQVPTTAVKNSIPVPINPVKPNPSLTPAVSAVNKPTTPAVAQAQPSTNALNVTNPPAQPTPAAAPAPAVTSAPPAPKTPAAPARTEQPTPTPPIKSNPAPTPVANAAKTNPPATPNPQSAQNSPAAQNTAPAPAAAPAAKPDNQTTTPAPH